MDIGLDRAEERGLLDLLATICRPRTLTLLEMPWPERATSGESSGLRSAASRSNSRRTLRTVGQEPRVLVAPLQGQHADVLGPVAGRTGATTASCSTSRSV